MTGYTDFGAKNALQHMAGEAPYASPTVYIALFSAMGAADGTGYTEISGSGYARVQAGGIEAAGGAWTTSNNTIPMGSSAPAWIVNGMNVHDATTGLHVGTVQGWSGTTLTLTGNAANASSGAADSLVFSAFAAASASDPSVMTNGAAVVYPASTAAWPDVVGFGYFDALTGGNLLGAAYLGASEWFPFTCTSAAPGVLTAPGITANSVPVLGNGAMVQVAPAFGGVLPAGLSAGTIYTVAGLASDTFNLGTNTTTTGSGIVRQVGSQSIPAGYTFSFQPGMLILDLA